jgi:hypothetical protein
MNLSRFFRPAAVLALGLLLTAPVARAAPPEQVPLTAAAAVEGIVQSYPEVKRVADALEAQYGDQVEGDDMSSALQALAKISDAQGQLDAAVKPYFNDYATWVTTLVSVGMAYGFLQSGDEMDSGMAEAAAAIQNNPQLSDAQKQAMMLQMQASMGAINAVKPPQANIDAVKPYADRLKAIFDDSSDD